MRFLLALTVLVLLPAARAYADEPLRLETPPKVDALQTSDVDGDGTPDVVTLSSRTVCVWTAGRDALPGVLPRWRVELPPDASIVEVARGDLSPGLICVGDATSYLLRLDRPAADAMNPVVGGGLGWRSGRPVFANLHVDRRRGSGFLVPSGDGWRLRAQVADVDEVVLTDLATREVVAAGPFLEDVATVTSRTPVLARIARGNAAGIAQPSFLLWGVVGEALVGWTQASQALKYDLSFLPPTGDRRLLWLDLDTVPDVVHRDGDNRERRYAFFRVPAPKSAQSGGWIAPDPRPPAAFLRLSGFNLDPDYVDVDGDGLVDFVVTTMALDGPNIFRAVATGKVTATTLAFLQRKEAPNVPMFPTQPDATVVSEIGVKIRFAHTGTLDVRQSFTILAAGDVDGDGRKDLVIRSGPSTLLVRKGTATGVWAKEATTLAIPAVGAGEECEATAANLDGRPGDELLLHYRGAESAPDRLVVVRP